MRRTGLVEEVPVPLRRQETVLLQLRDERLADVEALLIRKAIPALGKLRRDGVPAVDMYRFATHALERALLGRAAVDATLLGILAGGAGSLWPRLVRWARR